MTERLFHMAHGEPFPPDKGKSVRALEQVWALMAASAPDAGPAPTAPQACTVAAAAEALSR